jgi:hypothetical protein
MFTQPSVNQITSAYQGNPAPLARKVDQDKKQNNGIPQDLRQLLALNDITQGRQNMGIQQALQIPTNMPTVAQDLQERARQALQARQMQAMQEMQRKNGQPNMVPPGTPRPPMQAQGLDSLETNVGEGYAEGGIIGYDDGGRVQHFQSKGLVSGSLSDASDSSETFDILADRPREAARKKAEQEAEEKMRFLEVAAPEVAERIKKEKPQVSGTPVSLPTQQLPTASIRSQLNAADAASRSQPGTPPPPRERPAAQTQTRVNTDSAPMPAGLKDLAGIPSTSAAYKKLTDMMNQDPEAKAQELRDRYMKEVGSRDLSIYDKTAAELEARKQKLNAPKAGYDAMMEYLEQVAMGGGRTAAESGSMGASRQRALQKERLSQQDTLMDKILELGAKKSEAQYAEKKGMFDMTSKERDEIFKKAFDAAKSVNSSDDEAKRIAAQAVENEKNRQNQIRTAQIGAQDRDQLMNRAKALMAVDKTLTLEQAMTKAALAAGASSVLSTETKDKAKGMQDLLALNEKMPASLRQGNSAMAKENRRLYEIALAALEKTYGPLTSGINTLPSAGGPTSSNVRSQADAIISGGR